MRRIVLMSLVVWLVFGAVEAAADEPLRAAASFAIIADFVQQVGGDRVEVVSLVPALADPHAWEPTPQEARYLAGTQVLFVNGAGYEEWLWDLVRSASQSNLVVVELSAGLEPLPGPSHSVHSDHRHDPHFWLSVANAVHYVERIAQTLMELDPKHAEYYRERADVYQKELWSLTAGCSSSWLLFLLKTVFWSRTTMLLPILLSATVSPRPSFSLTTLIANLLPEIWQL